MATINGIYIFVETESCDRQSTLTSHPTEEGLPITDMARQQPLTISLSGKIVDYGNTKASEIFTKITTLWKNGSMVTYSGVNKATNFQIESFNCSYSNTNNGGADFDMTLKEIRIAKSSYTPKTKTNKAQDDQNKNNPDLSVGSIVVFKGGNVYVSSDATKAAAKRGRSTCKITKISLRSWSIHQYHLISTDGGMVYGWVDKENIEGTGTSGTSGTTNGGTQQITVTPPFEGKIYHTVKRGDTLWTLATTTYKEMNVTVRQLLENNPNCFSSRGNCKTLIIGSKLYIGEKVKHGKGSISKY